MGCTTIYYSGATLVSSSTLSWCMGLPIYYIKDVHSSLISLLLRLLYLPGFSGFVSLPVCSDRPLFGAIELLQNPSLRSKFLRYESGTCYYYFAGYISVQLSRWWPKAAEVGRGTKEFTSLTQSLHRGTKERESKTHRRKSQVLRLRVRSLIRG